MDDPAKLYFTVALVAGFLVWLARKLGDKWIDGISAKLDKIDELEKNHIKLTSDVNNLGQKVSDYIQKTDERLTVIERSGRRSIGLLKKILVQTKGDHNVDGQ